MFLVILCIGTFIIAPAFGHNTFDNANSIYAAEYIDFLKAEDKTAYGDVVPMQYKTDYENSEEIVEATTLENYYCLRDYYQIYTKQQDKYGLCWAYASATSLETMIAINYGEFYNFSSAWAGLAVYYLWNNDPTAGVGYKDYEVGGGGNFNYFQTATTKTGLLLETDFDLSIICRTDATNYNQIFNDYKDKAINLGISYSKVSITKKGKSFYNQIKTHIKENGSLYASCYSRDIDTQNYTLCSSTGSATHAVSIIGWDDNFQASGWTSAGAWIALNSWGDDWGYDGVFYISYNDVVANTTMFGVKPSTTTPSIKVTSESHTPIANHYVGKYSANSPRNANGTINNKNIFKSGETINLSYKFSSNYYNSTYTILKNDIDFTNDFIVLSRTSDTISLQANDLPCGTYKLTFSNSNGKTITKELVVIDGLEIGYIHYNSPKTSDISYPGADVYFGDYNSFNDEILHYEVFTQNYAYFHVYLPSFSTLQSAECVECTAQNYVLNDSKTTFATATSYAKGEIGFTLYITENFGSATLRLTSLDGETKYIRFTAVYCPNLTFWEQSMKFVYMIPDYNGATGERDVPALKFSSNNNLTYLPNPSKGAYVFDGWYYDKEFNSPLGWDANGYYFSYNDSHIYDGSGAGNYYTRYDETPFSFSYLYIYAKWREPDSIDVTFVFDDQSQTQTIPINSDVEVPSLFQTETIGYELIWDKNLENVSNTMTVKGQLKLVNSNVNDIKIDNENSTELATTYAKGTTHNVAIYPTHIKENDITYQYAWLYCKTIDGRYRSINQTESALSLSKANESGYYKVQVMATDHSSPAINNDEYLITTSITESRAIKIFIEKAKTVIETYGITTDFTYNGKYQSIEETATISRSEENENILTYENNSFRDVGTGTHTVTIKAQETDNYKSSKLEIKVTIHPANVSIKVHNKRSALFSEISSFSYEVRSGGIVYNGDDLNIDFASNVNPLSAGTYVITAKSLNNNYNVNVINGEYEVYYETLSLALIIVIMIVLAGLLSVTSYFIVTKLIMISYLKDSRIDKEINDL